ncbi:hypothetical protein [Pararhizobium sp.]|nr:hypothetical protein [Pararhizobium sp.]MDO9415055.1 hypothetical protein [Pararhizobium sp.]
MRAVLAFTLASVFSILIFKYCDNTLGGAVPLATIETAANL